MENASKALIIAGGILLAMMILTMLISVGTSISDFEESQERTALTKQIEEFNNSYLAYNKTIMYGTDVLTVYNKAKNEENYKIEIYAIDSSNNNILIENSKSFKVSIFKCEKVDYDNETGRICRMLFKKIET